MLQHLAAWWSMVSAFLVSPLDLVSGRTGAFGLLPILTLVLLVTGLVLAFRWREKQALWLIPPFVATLLAPIAISLAYDMMGWFGTLFALAVGAIALLVWVGMIAGDATRRLPVLLVGFSFLPFVLFCGAFSIISIWG